MRPIIGYYYNTIKTEDIQHYINKLLTPEQYAKITYVNATVYFIASEWRASEVAMRLVEAGIEFTYAYRQYRQQDEDRLAYQLEKSE